MYNSGYTAQQFECTQFIGQKNVHSSPHRSLGLFIVQYVVFGVIVTLGRIQYTKQLFLRVVFFGGNFTLAHTRVDNWRCDLLHRACLCSAPLWRGDRLYKGSHFHQWSYLWTTVCPLGRARRLVRIRLLLVASTGKNTFRKLNVRNVFRKSSIHSGGPCNLSNPR